MQDGLNCKITGDTVGQYFRIDSNGMLVPDPSSLQMDAVKERFERQLHGDTGFSRRLAEIYMRADVDMSNRPLGSSPVISAGVKMFGVSPLKRLKYLAKVGIDGNTIAEKQVEKRERRIEQYIHEVADLHDSLDSGNDPAKKLLLEVEHDQLLTGGGDDNTHIGDVTDSALNFINRGNKKWSIVDTAYSNIIVNEAKALKEHLKEFGFREGEFIPFGAHVVRFLQDTDGMIGYPVFVKANSPLSLDVATRLLIESGVDTRQFVKTDVTDTLRGGVNKTYRVVDAISYILDHLVVSPADVPSIVSTLVRIQRHGYKMEKDGTLVAKDGKCRSIYPNAAIPAFIEAMTFTPFLQALKERKVDIMPSLQDRPTRQQMLKDMLTGVWQKLDYVGLAADWSKYDATVKGCILATVIYYAVRPFFNARWQSWVDAAMYILVYKYLIVSTPLAQINNDMLSEARKAPVVDVDDWSIFGSVNGLISGAKFTHGGGSLYGEVVIHRAIPRILGFEPVWGPQAGDDTDMGVPRSRVDVTNVTKTYQPIADAAAIYDLDMNVAKQIWYSYGGDVVQVFLQDIYQPNLNLFGVGSAFRYIASAPFAERDNGLSVAEQELAILSKLNNGWDNPYIRDVARFWLEKDQFMAALYKQYGSNAMNIIIQGVGESPDVIRQRLGLGDYEWGFSADAFDAGKLPINDIMAEVAANMSVSVDVSAALSRMNLPSDSEVNKSGDPLSADDESSD